MKNIKLDYYRVHNCRDLIFSKPSVRDRLVGIYNFMGAKNTSRVG